LTELSKQIDCAVVTGAGRGIGAAIARHVTSRGVPVLCISRGEHAQKISQELSARGGKAFAISVDLADTDATKAAVSQWMSNVPYRRFGVVLAAGVTGNAGGLVDSDLKEWLRVFQTNVTGNLAVVQALLPRMLEAGFGRILMFGGGGAAYAYPLFGGYALSKVAVVRATENLHAELAWRGDFSVVCLAPGAVETDMLRQIRKAGGEVRTVADISEPVNFAEKFLASTNCPFSGRFVHVRDDWAKWLEQKEAEIPGQQWFLRRIEP